MLASQFSAKVSRACVVILCVLGGGCQRFLYGPDYMSRAGQGWCQFAGIKQKSTSRLHDNRASPVKSSPAHAIKPYDPANGEAKHRLFVYLFELARHYFH